MCEECCHYNEEDVCGFDFGRLKEERQGDKILLTCVECGKNNGVIKR